MNTSLKNRIKTIFASATPEKALEEFRVALFEADFSASIVNRLLDVVAAKKIKVQEEMIQTMVEETMKILPKVTPEQVKIPIPGALLLIGVNGSGKTTVAGRLAKRFTAQGDRVVLAAADTFRAGAIEQLKLWGEKTKSEVVAQKQGSDPAAVVFDAWQKAIAQNAILIADTAGRLHNKVPLTDELKKVVRVLGKDGRGAPHHVYLVLDGTTGQNALIQSKEFLKTAPINGLIITKLDGSAKGGSALSASVETSVPIRYIGVGEHEDDLVPFEPESFLKELF